MFKFNFKVENETEEIIDDLSNPDIKSPNSAVEIFNASDMSSYEAIEVPVSDAIISSMDFYELNATEITIGATTLRHILSGMVLNDIKTNSVESVDIKKSEESHSDLIPGVYEGGAKIWECTEDLLKYLALDFKSDYWKNKMVLDLGCGAGLLGIYALKNSATVHFQDYNQDVLERITIPNVMLNLNATNFKTEMENIKFYAGDWSNYATLTSSDEKFDLILTSETIYNPNNQQKLVNTFKTRLKRTGLVLVAAKTYYFGVGGSIRQFENLVKNAGKFKTEQLWVSAEGVNREIVGIRYNEC